MNKYTDTIIKTLLRSDRFVTLERLAESSGISAKTVYRILAQDRDELRGFGIEILSERGKGYSINIADRRLFSAYEASRLRSTPSADTDEDRIRYIESCYFTAGSYVRQERFLDDLCISEGTLKTAMRSVRSDLKEYGIGLRSTPYRGSKLEGDEFSIRLFFADRFTLHEIEDMAAEHGGLGADTVSEWVVWCRAVFWKNEIRTADDTFYYLCKYMMASFIRIQNGYVCSPAECTVSDQMRGTAEKCFAFTAADLSETEIRRFALLLSIHAHDRSLNNCGGFRDDLVRCLRDSSFPYLAQDRLLLEGLMSHIESLRIRIALDYHQKILPPVGSLQVDDEADRLVKNLIRELETWFGSHLDESEYSLLMMHILLGLQREKYSKKKNIVLICPSGLGEQYYLRMMLESELQISSDAISVRSFEDLKNDEPENSVIISTKMIPFPLKNEYILISFPISDEQMNLIKKAIQEK